MYVKYEPKVGIFEQVMGFTKPFVAGGQETPKSRRPIFWGSICCAGCCSNPPQFCSGAASDGVHVLYIEL